MSTPEGLRKVKAMDEAHHRAHKTRLELKRAARRNDTNECRGCGGLVDAPGARLCYDCHRMYGDDDS